MMSLTGCRTLPAADKYLLFARSSRSGDFALRLLSETPHSDAI